MKKKLLGYVGVDSGQLMICDPCYIGSEWDEKEDFEPNKDIKEREKMIGNFSYGGCAETTLSKNNYQLNFKKGHTGAGVVFCSGYGDGHYPVYGTFNKEGRCMKVEILMN